MNHDRLKIELCEKEKVILIVISYEYDYKNKEKLKNFLIQKLIEKGFLRKNGKVKRKYKLKEIIIE